MPQSKSMVARHGSIVKKAATEAGKPNCPLHRFGCTLPPTSSAAYLAEVFHLEMFASLPQTWWVLAGIVALILIGLIVRRIIRANSVHAVHSQRPSLRSQPHLVTPDGHTVLPLPNLDAGGCVIGRAPDADVHLDAILPCADSVAARHARIYRDATSGFVIIETLDTTRGVWINGVRAARKNLLKDHWVIGLGECTLIYRDGNPDTGPLR